MELLEKISDYSLEEIMGERFRRYAKYIIQDRAIPDIRDGLKPVQRRILYSMYKDKNTFDHGYRKSAKAVGNIMGSFHPHGDSSIYDAMVRMSQWWKQSTPYIDMHGNNGSIDGDSPAAMRYTESRLAKISSELLKDIDKDTVIFAPNYDDTLLEPTVLPAKFPNLLVNGTTGISAGYATNIPPHNLGEVIDATIKRIDSPNLEFDTILNIIKGPDFPTGGIIEGLDGIKSAYKTGRGKIIVKAKTSFESDKSKNAIIINEIPFEVNKALLVKKIDDIRIDKKIEGIIEVRDESDKDGLRIAIDVKKEANKELILNYLFKNTDLMITYNFNMIAIVNRRPKLLGIIEMLDAYIAHQREVITKRTEFDLEHAKTRLHIVEGLIKCLGILDEVIKTIRASLNKADSIKNLVSEYGFTELQATAIVEMQLYRLTNTDVTLLEEELENLRKIVAGLELILSDENAFKNLQKKELREIKDQYATPRITMIRDEVTEIKIDTKEMISKEDVIVLVTKDGYVKRCSERSYKATEDTPILKENDYIIGLFELNTIDTVLLFTNLGNYLYLPVHEIPDIKWKDLGKHVSNIIKLDDNEEIISCLPVNDFDKNIDILLASEQGMIKRTKLDEFKSMRYSKPISCMKLKDNDRLISAMFSLYNNIFIGTYIGYGLWFDINEVPIVGLKTSGVKAIALKSDKVINVSSFNNEEYVVVVTDKRTAKRVKLSEFDKTSRARRGLMILREVKTNPYHVIKTFVVDAKEHLILKCNSLNTVKVTEMPIMDRYSTGSIISKEDIDSVALEVELIKSLELKNTDNIINEEVITPKVSLKEIDERLFDIDKYLDM